MKKSIIFFLQNGVGGAERMTINIAKLLPIDYWDIIFCKVNQPYEFQNGRIEEFIPKYFKITNIQWDGQVSFIRQLYKIIKIYKPDVVFSSVMPFNQRLLLLSLFFKNTRFIVRNDNYLFTINKIKQVSIKYTYRRAHSIIAQTEEMKDELVALGLTPEKIVVLHNLIDEEYIKTKASLPSPFPNDSTIRFVSVGRIAKQKGFDILIQAYKIVSEELGESELYIIGDNTGVHEKEFAKLKSLVVDLNLTSKVKFIGYTDNPYIYIKNADVFVLSSRFEGLPNVLVEAQFLNTPSAATTCVPIISRMIKNEENGILAEPENPKSLAKAMISATDIHQVRQIYQPSPSEDFKKIFL